MADMNNGVQMAQISALKNDLSECCVRLNTRVALIANRLSEACNQGFPRETAQHYIAMYHSATIKNIENFVNTVQIGHFKYWDDIFKDIQAASEAK